MGTQIVKALVAGAVLAGLVGCSAADAPCIIQRPPVGGYSILFKRQSALPAGCTNATINDFQVDPDTGVLSLVSPPASGGVSPDQWWDNWRFDLYTVGQQLVFRSDYQPTPGDGEPDDLYISKGTLPHDPTTEGAQKICTSSDMSSITADSDPLSLGGSETTYAIHATEVKFLDGARYQGSQLQITADLTFGSCTATYIGVGLAPSAFLGVVAPCPAGADQDKFCSPFEDLSIGRSTGSGYNPDYPVVCRTDIGLHFEFGDTTGGGDPQQGVCFVQDDATFPALE
jgi:hypothetical protein